MPKYITVILPNLGEDRNAEALPDLIIPGFERIARVVTQHEETPLRDIVYLFASGLK